MGSSYDVDEDRMLLILNRAFDCFQEVVEKSIAVDFDLHLIAVLHVETDANVLKSRKSYQEFIV
jgi:hypothetical protein